MRITKEGQSWHYHILHSLVYLSVSLAFSSFRYPAAQATQGKFNKMITTTDPHTLININLKLDWPPVLPRPVLWGWQCCAGCNYPLLRGREVREESPVPGSRRTSQHDQGDHHTLHTRTSLGSVSALDFHWFQCLSLIIGKLFKYWCWTELTILSV